MKLMKWILDVIQFVSEGALEIFTDTDNYPEVGFQPYTGEIYAHSMD